MSRNNVILTVITLFCVTLSGALFYQGLKGELGRVNGKWQMAGVPDQKVDQVLGEQKSEASNSAGQNLPGDRAKVVKVVDGDTIEVALNGVNSKVRYVGVDTPETVDPRRPVQCFGKEASDENKRLLTDKTVI